MSTMPSNPSRTMTAHIRGRSKFVWATISSRPIPSVLPANSEMIIMISARESASRSPAKILGAALGRRTRVTRCLADRRNARAVSSCSGSTWRAPSIVFSSTGQMTPKTMAATSIGVPILNTNRKTGTRAGAGTARPKWTIGSARSASSLMRPIATPTAMPTALAAAQPPSIRPRLGSRFAVASLVSHRWLAGPANH